MLEEQDAPSVFERVSDMATLIPRSMSSERPPWGYSTPLCHGVCLVSSDSGMFAFVSTIILGPALFFIIFVAPSPGVAVVASLLTAVSWGSGALVTFMDPGIIPSQPECPAPNPATKTVSVDGKEYIVNWCTTCNLFRPPRSSHCGICGSCILEHDHHCGVLGACIGKRNFRFFAVFLWSTTVLAAYVGTYTVLDLFANRHRLQYANTLSLILRLMLAMHTFMTANALFFFGCYYCYLTASNQTERENIRRKRNADHTPLSLEWVSNWFRRIFGPMPASQLPHCIFKNWKQPEPRPKNYDFV